MNHKGNFNPNHSRENNRVQTRMYFLKEKLSKSMKYYEEKGIYRKFQDPNRC